MSSKALLGRSGVGKKKKGSKNKKNSKADIKDTTVFDVELEAVEVKCVPSDQLQLTEGELKQEFSKSLSSLDPNQPPKITKFNFRSGEYISQANEDHLCIHFNLEGILCHTSELVNEEDDEEPTPPPEEETEAAENEETDGAEAAADGDAAEETAPTDGVESGEPLDDEKASPEDENEEENEENEANDEALPEDDEESPKRKGRKQPLVKNQFNFSERASQTFNQPMRDREMMTEAPPTAVFSMQATAANIYDEYKNKLLATLQSKNAAPNQKSEETKEETITLLDEGDALLHSNTMFGALKRMERVVNQNFDQNTYFEFKYYKDDDIRSDSPFLTPLWVFKHPETQTKMVTAVCWNKQYTDLFAVGYGSYDFHRQTAGLICIYSLKNVGFPERILHVESGVLSLHFHPDHPSLLCCGAYDGSVNVYDIRNRDDTPIYSSGNPEQYHSDPVWDVRWHTDELGQPINFYSISSDGQLFNWNMSKNELLSQRVMDIKISNDGSGVDSSIAEENAVVSITSPTKRRSSNNDGNKSMSATSSMAEEVRVLNISLCSCFDFNPGMEHLFLVGSEDGAVAQCSRQTHGDGFIKAQYFGHSMNVYAVRWNPFHRKTFVTASEDWSVKLWDADDPDAIISYDLGCAVNDVDWAPYSATVFSAVTSDGRLHIFDLEQNKNEPICSERITKKNASLTHVAFAPIHPVIIVGDSRGVTHCVKLSPQLYHTKSKVTGYTDLDPNTEKARLDKILKVTGNKVFDIRTRNKEYAVATAVANANATAKSTEV